MLDPIIDDVERAIVATLNNNPNATLRDFARAATRAVLAPLPAKPDDGQVRAQLARLGAGLEIIKCDCGRSPEVKMSHERSCAGQLQAARKIDPHASAPVTVS